MPANPFRISLRAVLLHGDFGPFALGMLADDVVRTIGPPTASGCPHKGVDQVWRYGDIELLFDHEASPRIYSVETHMFDDRPVGGGGVELDPWLIRDGLALPDFVAAIEAAGGHCSAQPGTGGLETYVFTHRTPSVYASFGPRFPGDRVLGLTGVWMDTKRASGVEP